jgi:CRP-like cAMP-binding protein
MQNNKDILDNVPKDVFLKLKSIAKLKEVKARTQLVKQGKKPTKLYLLVSGIMRSYLTSEKGKEYNKRFFFPMDFAGALTALVKKETSSFVYETLTNCTIYEVNFKDFKTLCETNIYISNFYAKALEFVFMDYEKRHLDLITLSSSQRYLKLIQDMPDLGKLIPQYHIASYLNITPVQLSRIKRALKL